MPVHVIHSSTCHLCFTQVNKDECFIILVHFTKSTIRCNAYSVKLNTLLLLTHLIVKTYVGYDFKQSDLTVYLSGISYKNELNMITCHLIFAKLFGSVKHKVALSVTSMVTLILGISVEFNFFGSVKY